ncbi:hypothetical protein A3A93_06345 [Candidatus Roizmanbacteria bacterium RIFCSPLOWO2_01_FULL_38_12]|uniref:Chromate transporter n=2 Tax=Candidatus Roizmaniibacteriota TaxID=1752723 RepID=A0A1F7HIU9_9BACT|nr:MAG: hypothetical protein A3F29_03275 [Candidatus Roizmanbacteria bacterium RIFCSPHIGHO2_12_FULL_33_9]OGK46849.1 MAG: hypothetical protein A3A93_06345 [Candidatus Roizmanbacteria bacterium RIFCSPLOWO2_01_FULL_38_12]
MAEKSNGGLGRLENTLKKYFVDKAPFQIPDDIKEIIVKFGPWVILVLMILSLPVIFAALGLTAVLSPFAMMSGYQGMWFVPMILNVIVIVLELIALPGLFKRTITGWRYAYYATLVSIVASLASYQILGAIISGLIGFYVLFQVKEKYK